MKWSVSSLRSARKGREAFIKKTCHKDDKMYLITFHEDHAPLTLVPTTYISSIQRFHKVITAAVANVPIHIGCAFPEAQRVSSD